MSFMMMSIIIISITGTLSHFMYDITNHNRVMGLFAAVNESTWEHIKIALTPTIIWSLVDGWIYGNNPNYFTAKLFSLITIVVVMPVLYYGYKILFGKDNAIINILIFYVVIVVSQYVFNYTLAIPPVKYLYRYLSCTGCFIVFGGYMLLTLMPLENFIFKDPITGKYGYDGHSKAFNIYRKGKAK